MNITTNDIGKTITVHDGTKFKITEIRENDKYPVVGDRLTPPRSRVSWTAEGKYMIGAGQTGTLDVISISQDNSTGAIPAAVTGDRAWDEHLSASFQTDGNARSSIMPCTHIWVGTGFAHGAVFCKTCDVSYNELIHGDSGL